jgi:hypothetical protein
MPVRASSSAILGATFASAQGGPEQFRGPQHVSLRHACPAGQSACELHAGVHTGCRTRQKQTLSIVMLQKQRSAGPHLVGQLHV